MNATSVRLSSIALSASMLVAAAGTRADVISGSPDYIQQGFEYDLTPDAPVAYGGGGGGGGGGGSGGSVSAFKLFSVTAEVQPVGSSTAQGTPRGLGSMLFTDTTGIAQMLNFEYQFSLATRRREPPTSRPTMDIVMERMDISGLPGWIMLRESPTLVSTGVATIDDLGSGRFRIDSFFDVFTELSLDGGQNWLPASASMRLTLVPTPGAASLMSLGLLGLRRKRAR